MTEQHIQSQDISIAELFMSFYVVPDYQREYVWEDDEVEQLLTDIAGEMGASDAASAPEYFIGSIVVCPGKDGLLELIDGQQRMTTIFVGLCAIRDHIRDLGQQPPRVLDGQIAAYSADVSGREVERYRLDLQYEDSGEILVRIARGSGELELDSPSRSMNNILGAYRVIRQFLQRSFGAEAAGAQSFYGYLTNKVKLIRIQAQDVAKALKIFETINDRGVGLNAMDLLKNLLFMKANREQFDSLKKTWKELQDTLFSIGEKPLRFLRYVIFSRYDVDQLREDEIYQWFSRNEAICGYSKAPLAFAGELLDAANAYKNFFYGCDKAGRKSRYLENMQLLGGKAARQHLILLLAGRHLEPPLFDRLCSEVENLFFCYVITREPTTAFERNFALWAREIRAARTSEELGAVISTRFAFAKADLAPRFVDAFNRFTTSMLQTYRLRYVLAKLTQYVEIAAYGETESTRWLSRLVAGGFEIEHIFPQSPSEQASQEFGPCDVPDIAQRLGNLTLVEKSINSSLGNGPYSQKKLVYPQSRLLWTHAIAEKPRIGAATKIDRAVAELTPYQTWSETTIRERQALLTRIAGEVWGVPLFLA